MYCIICARTGLFGSTFCGCDEIRADDREPLDFDKACRKPRKVFLKEPAPKTISEELKELGKVTQAIY